MGMLNYHKARYH